MFPLVAALMIAAPDLPTPCPKDEPIKVIVLVILATDKNSDVDDRLQEIAAEVRKKEPQLTGFRLHKTINRSLKIGEATQAELCGNSKVELLINERTDNEGRMTITVKPPKLEEITYACTCGKFFPIITNCHPENQRLIIAVMAKPCKKKQAPDEPRP